MTPHPKLQLKTLLHTNVQFITQLVQCIQFMHCCKLCTTTVYNIASMRKMHVYFQLDLLAKFKTVSGEIYLEIY